MRNWTQQEGDGAQVLSDDPVDVSGLKGNHGECGPIGSEGPDGEKGAKGEAGLMGETGMDGEQGQNSTCMS